MLFHIKSPCACSFFFNFVIHSHRHTMAYSNERRNRFSCVRKVFCVRSHGTLVYSLIWRTFGGSGVGTDVNSRGGKVPLTGVSVVARTWARTRAVRPRAQRSNHRTEKCVQPYTSAWVVCFGLLFCLFVFCFQWRGIFCWVLFFVGGLVFCLFCLFGTIQLGTIHVTGKLWELRKLLDQHCRCLYLSGPVDVGRGLYYTL